MWVNHIRSVEGVRSEDQFLRGGIPPPACGLTILPELPSQPACLTDFRFASSYNNKPLSLFPYTHTDMNNHVCCVHCVCIHILVYHIHVLQILLLWSTLINAMPKTIIKSKFIAFTLTLCRFYNLRKTLAIKHTRFSNHLNNLC